MDGMDVNVFPPDQVMSMFKNSDFGGGPSMEHVMDSSCSEKVGCFFPVLF